MNRKGSEVSLSMRIEAFAAWSNETNIDEDNIVEGNHREMEPVSCRNVQLHQPARLKANLYESPIRYNSL